MKIAFTFQNLTLSPEQQDIFARIVWTIADGWHEWHRPDPTSEQFTGYFQRNPQHFELASKSFANSLAYGSSNSRTVTICDTGDVARPAEDIYPLEKAFDFLSQPLRVLVENEISDGHFYLRYLKIIDPDLAYLFSSPRPPIAFDQGGGNMEIVKLVEHRVDRSKQNSLMPRIVVLADSDSKYPGHMPAETNKLVQTCEGVGIPVHVTRKRSQENYIPDIVFLGAADAFEDLQAPVQYIIGLSKLQRDHYPIKAGLSGRLSEGETHLYGDLPPREDELPKMKVPRIAQYFREKYGDSIDLDQLTERECDGEFRAIAELLRGEL